MSYLNPVCKGSWAFGNNCMTCERCVETEPKMEPVKVSLNFNQPPPIPKSIEDQLKARAKDQKCFLGWFNEKDQFISFWHNLSYMERLFVIDALQCRLRWETAQDEAEG